MLLYPSPGENTMPVTLMAMLRFKAQEIFTALEKATTATTAAATATATQASRNTLLELLSEVPAPLRGA